MRLVSMIPSATDIIVALGLTDHLVGISHECDLPAGMAELPRLTAPCLDPQAPGDEIDRSVRDLLDAALSVFEVDSERLRSLAPDVILTQDQCDVCAIGRESLVAALASWTGAQPRLVSLAPASLAEILDDIERVAAIAGVPERGTAWRLAAKQRIDDVRARTASRSETPRIAFLEWLTPPMDGGLWIPEMIELAGGRPIFGTPRGHSRRISVEDLLQSDPDILIAAPCGFDLQRTAAEFPALRAMPELASFAAVHGDNAALCDGNRFFNRPGPGLIESLEILCEIIHPAIFGAPRCGSAWRWAEAGPAPS